MAGDWIKMRVGIADEPEVIGIAGTLGIEEDAVVGKLHRLWSWADQHTVDGNAPSVTETWLDRYVGVTGFASAMQDVGWLQIGDGHIVLPDFDKHNGQTGKSRALTARRVKKKRTECNAPSVTPSVTSALPKEDKREDKREEEKKPPTPLRGQGGDTRAEWANRIYQAYPRKVRPANALKAIEKALKRAPPDILARTPAELLELTQQFAAAVEGADQSYVPHPATWFNAGGWGDDPDDWARIGRDRGKNQQPGLEGKTQQFTAW
jgi:hypothetical protein